MLRERRKITLVTEFKSFFSEILVALNLRGSPVRLTEFELRCEVYYVASFKLIWTFVAFTVRGKTTNWLYTSLGRWYYFQPAHMHGTFDKPNFAQGYLPPWLIKHIVFFKKLQNAWNKQDNRNFSLACNFLFEGGCYEKDGKLRLSQNLNHFPEILAVLNLCGSSVRLMEFELRCEVYYVASFKLIWTFVAFTVRGKTNYWLYASLMRWYYF